MQKYKWDLKELLLKKIKSKKKKKKIEKNIYNVNTVKIQTNNLITQLNVVCMERTNKKIKPRV